MARSKKVLALVAAFVENEILSSSSKGEMRRCGFKVLVFSIRDVYVLIRRMY